MNHDADEIDAIKSRVRISDLLGQFGFKVRGGFCLCPFRAEKTPSCQVFEAQGRIHCHGCGKGGDHFDVLKAVKGFGFKQAIEYLGGRKELTFDERQHFRRQREEIEKQESDKDAAERERARKLFESGDEIRSTLAVTYLKNRGLTVSKRMWFDLRYADRLPYWGFPDAEAEKSVDLGAFPAMLAAIRKPDTGELIGTHRTYLEPQTGRKLTPPGDPARNKAKKVMGQFRGGLIMLSPPSETGLLLMGEGIETSESGYEMEIGGSRDAAVAAAVNIWNMCGSATDTIAHPKRKNTRVPNGIPDPDKPSVKPPSWVTRLILLGDGDSEPVWTRAMLATAAQRYMDWMIDTTVCMAPEGEDFNDVHLRELNI